MTKNTTAASSIKKAREHVNEPLRAFFYTEIRNEREGGVSPATLDSAFDSFENAPEDVLESWMGGDVINGKVALLKVRDMLDGGTTLQELV